MVVVGCTVILQSRHAAATSSDFSRTSLCPHRCGRQTNVYRWARCRPLGSNKCVEVIHVIPDQPVLDDMVARAFASRPPVPERTRGGAEIGRCAVRIQPRTPRSRELLADYGPNGVNVDGCRQCDAPEQKRRPDVCVRPSGGDFSCPRLAEDDLCEAHYCPMSLNPLGSIMPPSRNSTIGDCMPAAKTMSSSAWACGRSCSTR